MRTKTASIGYGSAVTLILLLSFGLLISLLLRFTSLSEQWLYWPMIICSVISFLIGGIVAGVKSKEKGLMAGMLAAAMVCFIILAFQYLGLETSSSLEQGILFLIFLLSSGAGGALGVNTVSAS
ncbi:TIGR04086 family membrane protein [Alteribacillus sp. HJP-4]|uniref:TIGR04086 family membrane protein n=1 Tax=Alteribacillus sp. HJP-4 TaxID=2775394 RepID=UPI0035CD37B6